MKKFLTALTIFAISTTLTIPTVGFANPDNPFAGRQEVKKPKDSDAKKKDSEEKPAPVNASEEIKKEQEDTVKANHKKLIDALTTSLADTFYEISLRDAESQTAGGMISKGVDKLLLKRKIRHALESIISSDMLVKENQYITGIPNLEVRLAELSNEFADEYIDLLMAVDSNQNPLALKTKARTAMSTLAEAYLAAAIYYSESNPLASRLALSAKYIWPMALSLGIITQLKDSYMPDISMSAFITTAVTFGTWMYYKDKINVTSAQEGYLPNPIKKFFSQNKTKMKDTLNSQFWNPILVKMEQFLDGKKALIKKATMTPDSLTKEEIIALSDNTIDVEELTPELEIEIIAEAIVNRSELELIEAHKNEIESLLKNGKHTNDFKMFGYILNTIQSQIKLNCVDLLIDL